MALLPAYAIDGGRVPASMLRMLAWVSTGGASGIVAPGDFKVQALTTPGGAVSINAGGAVIPTRYGNSTAQQSYVVANDQAFNLSIPAAGAAGRTEYVILRISDPQYSGQVPADPENALYVEAVTVATLPTDYPYLALAKLVLPANTATVTNSMITDMRKLAMPRRHMEIEANYPTSENLIEDLGGAYEVLGEVTVSVPTWATHMRVKGDFASMGVRGGVVQGYVNLASMGQGTYVSTFKAESNGTGSTQRWSTVCVGTWTLGSQYKGTDITIQFRARQTGSWNNGVALVDSGTTLAALVEFEERAV